MEIAKELYESNANKVFISKSLADYNIMVIDYVSSDYNNKWHIPKDTEETFKEFFYNIVKTQCNPYFHPLTCGVDSNHELLVPRMDYQGNKYLICPTCGYVQSNSLWH